MKLCQPCSSQSKTTQTRPCGVRELGSRRKKLTICRQDASFGTPHVEPGVGGVKRYRVRGNEIRAEADFTGAPTGRLAVPPKPPVEQPAEAGPDGWLVGAADS
jgi:hypothetical protein